MVLTVYSVSPCKEMLQSDTDAFLMIFSDEES